MRRPKQRPASGLNRSSTALDADRTMIAVVEMGLRSWLVAGIVPGVERQPLKKLGADENDLLDLLNRWCSEAARKGYRISRIPAVGNTHDRRRGNFTPLRPRARARESLSR